MNTLGAGKHTLGASADLVASTYFLTVDPHRPGNKDLAGLTQFSSGQQRHGSSKVMAGC